MKAVASRGKSTKGWFFGFKLHGVCTEDGTLVKICFRAGSEHDSKAFDSATKGLVGLFVTDAGYLLKEEELEKMYASARKPVTATRKNMKRIMTKEQFHLLRNRNIIENVWFQVPAEYANNLLGGIILTGGGSNLKNIEFSQNHTVKK